MGISEMVVATVVVGVLFFIDNCLLLRIWKIEESMSEIIKELNKVKGCGEK